MVAPAIGCFAWEQGMKMHAIIEVEFEADEKHGELQRPNLENSLRRGVEQLKSSIEYGIGSISVPTGVKRGTVKATVTHSTIAP
jgi:hypothetical protein